MQIIGHRGAKGLAPENTLASFRKALEHGVDAIEFDVRVSKDNVAVLSHDPVLHDAAGTALVVHDHTYSELKAHKPDIATLAEVLTLVNRRVPMIVEIKPHEPVEPVITVIRQFLKRGWQPNDIHFISFDFRILQQLHRAFPQHQLIVDEMWSSIRAVYRARRVGSRHISLWHRYIWSGFIKSVTRRGYSVYTFALNDVEKAQRWQAVGLAGVITDYPDRFEK